MTSAETLVKKTASSRLITAYGEFAIDVFRDAAGREHVALRLGRLTNDEPTLVRVQSECLTGEVFHSLMCDCRQQLDLAMKKIAAAGVGAIIYLRQEGRDIGLTNKIKAYELQRQGLDTVEANERLGFPPDARDYGAAAAILAALGIRQLRLLTNNPDKAAKLSALGLNMVERVPLVVPGNGHNEKYLAAKKAKLGHLL